MAPSPPGPRQRAPEPQQARRKNNVACTIEDQVRYAYFTPAPGAYDPNNPLKPDYCEPRRGGKISEAHVPSALDALPKTKTYVPGPGSYAPEESRFTLPEGGRLNRNAPKKQEKLIDEYPTPAPGAYGVPGNPAYPRVAQQKFSKQTRVPEYIQKEVVRARGVPGPGSHDVQGSMESFRPFCPEGGRCLMQTKPTSYFDQAPTLADGKPGPDHYNLKGAVEDRAVGRLVYRYESSTIKETKAMVNKAVGESTSAPGPGAYSVPDPQPIAGVPTLKSRHYAAMPHPFAYNCQPDHGNKFSTEAFAPVRQQNNAGLIYGNGVRPEDVARNARKGSRPASVHGTDQVLTQDMPLQLRGIDDGDEGRVEWKDGGFANLKKSRSTGSIKEHPCVGEARKFYPLLAARNRASNASFRPMASRKAETFSTREASDEHHRLRCGKWKLAAVAEGLQQATAGALETLDLDKLKQDAMEGLRAKAKAQMRLEGISREQQSLVLEELSSVLEEHKQVVRAKRPAASSSTQMQLAEVAQPQAAADAPAAATPSGGLPAAPPPPPDLGGLSAPPMAV